MRTVITGDDYCVFMDQFSSKLFDGWAMVPGTLQMAFAVELEKSDESEKSEESTELGGAIGYPQAADEFLG